MLSAHDVTQATNQVATSLTEMLQVTARGLAAFGRALGRAGYETARFIFKSIDAYLHYPIGRHLFPIRSELLGNPQLIHPCDLNFIGSIALIPLTMLTFLSSITIVPLIGNSFQSMMRAYISSTNLSLWDSEEWQLGRPAWPVIGDENDPRRWWRQVYGLPGWLIGCAAGLFSSAIITLFRAFTNSAKSAVPSFENLTNCFLHKDEKFQVKPDERHWYPRFVLGAPGILLGLIAAVVAWLPILLARFITNNFKTGFRAFISALNLGLENKLDHGLEDKDNRHWLRKYVLGSLSFLFGGFFGILAAVAASSFNSAKTFFLKIVNFSLDKRDELSEKPDERPFYQKWIFGFPGIFLERLLQYLLYH